MRLLGATASGPAAHQHLAGFQPVPVEVPETEVAHATAVAERIDRHAPRLEFGMEGGGVGGDEDRKGHAGPSRRERFAGLQLPQGETVPIEGEDYEALDRIGMRGLKTQAL